MAYKKMSLEEIGDRLEINDLLTRYTTAIDTKDWELLDTCFTPDARVDYTSSGGIAGSYPEAREWLAKVLAAFPVTVHYITNSTVKLEGDGARATTYVFNPMRLKNPDDSLHAFNVGAYYHDKLVRTDEGWRIADRFEEMKFLDGEIPGEVAPQK
jgi:3-phenylpropionate/cinnamic acid dioxygenase small subunit